MRKIGLLTLLLLIPLTSCATIVNDSHQPVTITSDPPGAKFIFSSGEQGITPATVDVKRGEDYTIQIYKEGYITQTAVDNSHFEHWLEATLGNIWNYIIPGLIVDAIDGRAESLDKKMINVELDKKNSVEQSNSPAPHQSGK